MREWTIYYNTALVLLMLSMKGLNFKYPCAYTKYKLNLILNYGRPAFT